MITVIIYIKIFYPPQVEARDIYFKLQLDHSKSDKVQWQS